MQTFKDHFSGHSELYARYRPHYPAELFSFLSDLSNDHKKAWDCGTGNGQAAISLTEFYDEVIATDPSEAQIKNSFPHPKIKYLVQSAEDCDIQPSTVDLVTIANALHWLDVDIFYKTVRRVLKKEGIIAAWAYGIPEIAPGIDAVIKHLHDVTLNDFWLRENRLVENNYRDIAFPFEEINTPAFAYKKEFNLADTISYLNTWSATQKYIHHHHINPTAKVFDDLKSLWGDELSKRELAWKLILKAGRV